MDSTDNDSLHALTDEQIKHLVAVVFEYFGPGLSRTQFNDVVLLMFENIAGLETLTRKQATSHLRNMWVVYRRIATSNRSH